MGAEFFVAVAAEPGAKVFAWSAIGKILAQEALDGFRDQRCRATITDRARDGGVLADRAAKTEIICVGELAFVLDFFAFNADVGYPVLSAAVGAAGYVE